MLDRHQPLYINVVVMVVLKLILSITIAVCVLSAVVDACVWIIQNAAVTVTFYKKGLSVSKRHSLFD